MCIYALSTHTLADLTLLLAVRLRGGGGRGVHVLSLLCILAFLLIPGSIVYLDKAFLVSLSSVSHSLFLGHWASKLELANAYIGVRSIHLLWISFCLGEAKRPGISDCFSLLSWLAADRLTDEVIMNSESALLAGWEENSRQQAYLTQEPAKRFLYYRIHFRGSQVDFPGYVSEL